MTPSQWTDAQPIPQQQLASAGQIPPVYMLSMALCGTEYPFCQFGLVVLVVFPLSSLCISLLVEHATLKSPSLRVSIT